MKRLFALIASIGLLAAASNAFAQARSADILPLGQGSQSGATCDAVRDYDDPIAQHPGGRAWTIRCHGWDTPIGKLYLTQDAQSADALRKSFEATAACQPGADEAVAGLTQTSREACRLSAGNTPYLIYQSHRGQDILLAQGYAVTADIMESGLKVVSGAAPIPAGQQVQMSQASADIAAEFGGSAGGLADAEKAAAFNAPGLTTLGYVQNNEWRFDQAESVFGALSDTARDKNAPPREQAESLLNFALNISDSGHFADADAVFDRADQQVAAANDPVLRAKALNYRALHLRNQGKFSDAIAMADQALAVRAAARAEEQAEQAASSTATASGDAQVTIGTDLSDKLNGHSQYDTLMGAKPITQAERLAIEDIQSIEIIGSSKIATGDLAGADEALNRGLSLLASIESTRELSVKLRARLLADLGDLDTANGRAGAAADHYNQALQVLRTRHANSATEAGLLLDLGRAQIATGANDAALATYERAFQIFKDSRGSLGDSADGAQPYFDLLLSLSASDPAHASSYAERFFSAAELVVNSSTASTVAQLAARVASGDNVTAGLVREVDDARRRLNAAESRVADLQAHDRYTGQDKTDADQELKARQAELQTASATLLNNNPRYQQLVVSDATLPALQGALRPNEVYIKILMLADRGYGLMVSNSEVKPYAIDLTRDQAVRMVSDLRVPFDATNTLPPFDVAKSYALFQTLFGPVQPDLLGAKHLIYEPDTVLIGLPVAVMVTDAASVDLRASRRTGMAALDYRGVNWLGAKVDSSLILSASSFLQSRAFKPSAAQSPFLGFGDPSLSASNAQAYKSVLHLSDDPSLTAGADCEATRRALLRLPDLPDTAREVQSVAASLGAPSGTTVLGSNFNDGAVRERKDLNQFRVLYFATHALLPMASACLPQPALVMSATGPDSDGLFSAEDFLNLNLDADLVVLSACDTGGAGADDASGTGLQGGGGPLGGLARVSIYAGARSLIVSHWSIDSNATVKLMTGMFQSGAASTAEGLQQAQATLQGQARWSHPYYWAPFTIVGDGGRPIPKSTAS